MKAILRSRFARHIAWTLIVCTTMLAVPVDVIAYPPKTQREQAEEAARTKLQQVIEKARLVGKQPGDSPQKDVTPLSESEMKQIIGRGVRNAYYCGTMPWHRSFRDVNVCTGNLFKSFTDIQVAPARGAGLVLQRTYNSNDERDGAFGRGWSHAYDVQMQEADSIAQDPPDIPNPEGGNDVEIDKMNAAVRTDFFGGKHVYRRDADGLYSPPPYSHDLLSSDYDYSTGPMTVDADTQTSQDGTVKHFRKLGDARVCDYIKDRHNNYTELAYDVNNLSMVVVRANPHIAPGGSYTVGDKALVFTWYNFVDGGVSHWRITQVRFCVMDSSGSPTTVVQTVDYDYFVTSEAGYGGELYNLKSVTLYPGGSEERTTTYTYQSLQHGQETICGLLSEITDPLGHQVTYSHSVFSDAGFPNVPPRLVVHEVAEPAGIDANTGGTMTWGLGWSLSSYGGGGVVIWSTTLHPGAPGVGEGVRCGYDAYFRTTDVHGPGRYQTVCSRVNYDAFNNVSATMKGAPGVVYKGSGNPGTNCVCEGYTYFHNGNVRSHWTYGFQGTGSPTNGFQRQHTYHYYGIEKWFQKKSVTDAAGRTTCFDYDSEGNLTKVWDAAHYPGMDANGDFIHPDYDHFEYTYNSYGQKVSELNLNGVLTDYYYNGDEEISYPAGWVDSPTVTQSTGNLMCVVQDPGATGHLNRTTWMAYNAAGNVTKRMDPNGQTSTVSYNSIGQPTQAFFPAKTGQTPSTPSETITYGYGLNGRMSSVSVMLDGDPLQTRTTSMSYAPGCDRVTSVADSVTGTISYTYTPMGSVLSKTLPGGKSWVYTYASWLGCDAMSALPHMMPSNPDDPGSYTEQPLSATDGDDRLLWQRADEISTTLLYDDEPCEQFNFRYDAADNVIGYTAEYRLYENVSPIEMIQEGTLPPFSLDEGADQIGDDFTTRGNLEEIVYVDHWLDDTDPQNAVWRYKVVSRNVYAYDDAGLRTSNHRYGEGAVDSLAGMDLGTESYQYDDLNRLTQATYPGGRPTQNYTFDDMGNRLSLNSTTYGYNAANQLKTINSSAYADYDNNGNMLTGGGRENTWDSQNRLYECKIGSDITRFTYGPDGLRRSMTVHYGAGNEATTHYLLEGQNVVQEGHLDNGTFVADVTYGMGLRGIEYREDSGGLKWYIYDGLGSVVAEVDDGASQDGDAIVTRNPDTDVYGNVSGTPAKHGFVGGLGHVTDGTGLMYMRARYYDPAIGRFVSEDPAGDGVNWYAYCGNPVSEFDLTGEEASVVGLGTACSIAETLTMLAIRLHTVLLNAVNKIPLAQRGAVPARGSNLWNWLIQQGEDPSKWRQVVTAVQQTIVKDGEVCQGFLKAWVRYDMHTKLVDAYIQAEAGELFKHATPYIGK